MLLLASAPAVTPPPPAPQPDVAVVLRPGLTASIRRRKGDTSTLVFLTVNAHAVVTVNGAIVP